MLGTLRFVLSLMVVFNHAWLPTANQLGAHAVTGFYIISGYLMSLVVNEVYTGSWGRLHFLANRFLRIFPLYWLLLAATVAGIVLLPEAFGRVYSLVQMPGGAAQWLSNLSLIGLVSSPVILIPPAWSLTVECFFYLWIGLVAGRSAPVACAWFAASAVLAIVQLLTEASFNERYYPLQAGSLYFSIGALLYHTRRHWWSRARGPWLLWVMLLTLYVPLPLVIRTLGGDPHMEGFYGATALFVPIFLMAVVRRDQVYQRWDRLLGDFSYPVFLSHFFCIGLTNSVARHLPWGGNSHFLLTLCLCLALSYAVVRWLEPALELVRGKVRARGGYGPPPGGQSPAGESVRGAAPSALAPAAHGVTTSL